jgi:aminoglycoside phosphotransferase (APT) family kinase protein
MQRSSRGAEEVRVSIESWLATKVDEPKVSDVAGTSETGMSSDTILFDASWNEAGSRRTERLVARIAPSAGDVPVFPSYDLERQARLITLVGELTDVPVPKVWWSGSGDAVFGSPFFVMERIDGEVPPDVLPYTFGSNWLYDAHADDRRKLADETVDVLARLHAVPEPESRFDFLAFDDPGATPLRKHVAHTHAWYSFISADGTRSPLVERGFRWIDDNFPADEGDAVLSWGDSRIGNVLYKDFEPVAVLDWEMAGLGPRELDVAWLICAHRVFEHLAHRFDAPGMPDFLRADDVAAGYEKRTGHRLRDLEFYMTYAALQWAIVFVRTGQRSVHFGEREMPDDVDELLHHRELFEQMLS